MKRLDQGHLHLKLDVPGPTCPGRESNPGLGGKEPFEQLFKSFSEHLDMSAPPVENARESINICYLNRGEISFSR